MTFKTKVQTEAKAIAETFSIDEAKAFAVWCAMIILDIDEDDAFDALAVEGPNEKGMDLFWVDNVNQQVFIAQCKYSSSGEHNPKVKDLDTLLAAIDWLASEEAVKQEGRPELEAAAREYGEAIEEGYPVRFWFVYAGKRDENIDKRIRAYNANPEHYEQRRSAVHCDMGLLEKLHEEVMGESRRIEHAQLPVDTNSFETQGSFGRGLVTSIDAERLVELYEQFRDYLFSRNVRGWLGARKGSVNAAIIGTAESDRERNNFWAYNNGITVVCDDFALAEDGTLDLHNFSIVNGCQTTVALAHAAKTASLSGISLLAKILQPPEQIIDDVIRFTNSQNPIRRWDLASQERTQRRLQDEFAALDSPFFYAIRRGEWRALSADEKRKFRNTDMSYRKIKHDLLAQYLAAFKGMAVTAYKDKAQLFEKFYDDVFPADLRVEEALFVWLAGELTQDTVREEIKKENERVNSGDREHEKYVLMLKRGGRFYCLGVFGLVADLRNGPDYLRSIGEERAVSNRGRARLSKYAKVSVTWYKQAVADLLTLSSSDLSVLIREKDFFNRVADRVRNSYETYAVNEDWMRGAIPELH
jgi:hypothetical protein